MIRLSSLLELKKYVLLIVVITLGSPKCLLITSEPFTSKLGLPQTSALEVLSSS